MTPEELKNVPMHFHSHMAMEHEHTTTYFSQDGKIGVCHHVPFRKNGDPRGRSYRHYWLDGKVYRSKKKFIEALAHYNP